MNTPLSSILIAMAVGIVGTSVIHVSKGMMAFGLALKAVAAASARPIGSEAGPRKPRGLDRGSAVYALGVAMNFTNPLWVIIANRFAPTPYYTSMYGLGLIALMIFSARRLGHRFSVVEYCSVGLIVTGTILFGVQQIHSPVPGFGAVRLQSLLIVAATWMCLSPLVLITVRRRALRLQEFFFGLTAGGMAALDAVLKGAAQVGPRGTTFFPTTATMWVVFAASFLGAAGAFGLIQWSYRRRCRPAMMSAVYDVSYTVVPLVMVGVFAGYSLASVMTVIGFACIVAGVVLPQWRAIKPTGPVSQPH